MRHGLWAAVVILGLGLVSSARAQPASAFTGGPNPRQIIFQPVDTSKAVMVPPAPIQRRGSLFTNLLSKFPFTGSKPRIGQSPLPPPSSFPSTQYKDALQPVLPIIPKL
jgi:hypothetical protein